MEFRANCRNNQRTNKNCFYQNFGSRIAKCYSMAKLSGAASKQDKKEQNYDLLKVFSEDNEARK